MMDYFKKTSVNRQTKKILSYVLMTVIGIILIIPLLWMVFTSLKPMEEIVRYPPTFFPEKIRMGKLSGYDCRLSFLALCKKYIIHHCASSDR